MGNKTTKGDASSLASKPFWGLKWKSYNNLPLFPLPLCYQSSTVFSLVAPQLLAYIFSLLPPKTIIRNLIALKILTALGVGTVCKIWFNQSCAEDVWKNHDPSYQDAKKKSPKYAFLSTLYSSTELLKDWRSFQRLGIQKVYSHSTLQKNTSNFVHANDIKIKSDIFWTSHPPVELSL
jgi:hypothetical protein